MSPDDRVMRQLVEALAFERLIAPTPDGWTVGGLTIHAPHRIGGFGRIRLLASPRDGAGKPLVRPILMDALTRAGYDTRHLDDSLSRTTRFLRAAGPIAPDRLSLRGPALESALIEGHPYHPCFKSRTGFTDGDNAAYGPEAGNSFPLRWLEIHPALIRQQGTPITPFPVHPWQWARLERDPVITNLVASGHIRVLDRTGPRYRATQSLRTLAPVDGGDHLKLSLSVGVTSSVRDIAPWSVAVAPAISGWLGRIVAEDPAFGRWPLTILPEHGAAIVAQGDLGGRLAAIRRTPPPPDAIPLNALSLCEPDGAPMIAPWLRHFGTERWLARYLRVVVLPVWHLMTRHGIGLEAHGQNLLVTVQDGWPTGLVARDFHESLEYVPQRLARPELLPDLAAIDPVFAGAADGVYHRMAQATDLRDLVMDCLCVHVLSELAALLHDRSILPQSRFWTLLRACLRAVDSPAVFATDAPVIPAERLVARVLGAGAAAEMIPNPLTKADPMFLFQIDDTLIDPDTLHVPDFGGHDPARTRVALHMTDKAKYLALVLRLRAVGASCYPIHAETPVEQAFDLARRTDCSAIVTDDGVTALGDAPYVAGGVLIQTSSGTTGAPKVIARSWAGIETEIDAYIRHFPNDLTPVVAAPVTHSYGLIAGVLVGMARGRTPVVLSGTNPKTILRRIGGIDRPLLYAAPALLHVMARLAGPDGLPAAVMSSGTMLPQPWFDTIKGAARAMFQQYGCSEAGCVALATAPASPEDMGTALPHIRLLAGSTSPDQIRIEGLGPVVATGDLGMIDPRGHLVFAGRAAEVIDVAGINVYPADIERVALTAPGVTDAVAFALPDPASTQRPALAFTGTITVDDLDAFLASRLAPRQRPVRLLPLPNLPRGPGGKVSRRILTESYGMPA